MATAHEQNQQSERRSHDSNGHGAPGASRERNPLVRDDSGVETAEPSLEGEVNGQGRSRSPANRSAGAKESRAQKQVKDDGVLEVNVIPVEASRFPRRSNTNKIFEGPTLEPDNKVKSRKSDHDSEQGEHESSC